MKLSSQHCRAGALIVLLNLVALNSIGTSMLAAQETTAFDVIIQGGTVYDGNGTAGVQDGRCDCWRQDSFPWRSPERNGEDRD